MLVPVLPQRHVAACRRLRLDRADVRHRIDRKFHPGASLAGVGIVGRDWRNQITTIVHHRRKSSSRVVNQHLCPGVPVNIEEFRVDASAAFPEEDAERINSVLRHDDVEGCVWVVCRISVLAARGIAETEQRAERVSRIRSGNTRPPVVHIQTEEVVSSLEIQVGSEFMHRIVQPEI